METVVPSVGNYFRLCSYSWFKRIIVYLLIFSFLWSAYPRYSYSFVPVIAGVMARQVVPKIIGRVLVRRFAANDAIYSTAQLTSTRVFLGRVAANSAEYLPAASSLKIGGVPTWAGVAAVVGSLVPANLNAPDGSVMVMTNGVKLSDNLYEVTYSNDEGKSKKITVNFEPSELSPVIVHVSRNNIDAGDPITGSEKGYSVPEEALYYYQDYSTLTYYYGDDPTEIARSYINNFNAATFKEITTTLNREVKNKIVDSQGNVSYENQPYKITYPIIFYKIDEIQHLYTNPDPSVFPKGLPMYESIAGLPMSHYVGFLSPVSKFSYSGDPFKTTNSPNGSAFTVCAAPEESEYKITQSEEKKEIMVTTNMKYKASSLALEAGNIESMIDYLAEPLQELAVSPALLAEIINELWMDAASQSNYDGMPLVESVSPAEVTAALSELGLSPTYLDLLSPISESPGAEVNIDISVNNNSGTDTGGSNKTDLGEDPKIASPELEETPTADEILKPIFDLLPFTQGFNIGSRSATCPIVAFSVFEHDYKIDSHCPLIEDKRAAIQTIFLIIWGFIALRVTLSA